MSVPATHLDMRCYCDRCVSRTKETYQLLACCSNCGEECVAVIRKGDRPSHSYGCPTCGVPTLMFQGLVK